MITLKEDFAARELFENETVLRHFISDALDDWVRLFNAETEEDLDMIATANRGIIEAVEIMKKMSLIGIFREEHELRVKARRDRMAEDEYVMDRGIQIGMEKGRAEGEIRVYVAQILSKLRSSLSSSQCVEELAELGGNRELLQDICNTAVQYAPDYDTDKIVKEVLSHMK